LFCDRLGPGTGPRAGEEPCAHVKDRALDRLCAAKARSKVAQTHDVIRCAEVDREIALALPVASAHHEVWRSFVPLAPVDPQLRGQLVTHRESRLLVAHEDQAILFARFLPDAELREDERQLLPVGLWPGRPGDRLIEDVLGGRTVEEEVDALDRRADAVVHVLAFERLLEAVEPIERPHDLLHFDAEVLSERPASSHLERLALLRQHGRELGLADLAEQPEVLPGGRAEREKERRAANEAIHLLEELPGRLQRIEDRVGTLLERDDHAAHERQRLEVLIHLQVPASRHVDELDNRPVQVAVVVGDVRDPFVELPEPVHELAVAAHEGARRNERGRALEARALLGATHAEQLKAPRRLFGRRVQRNPISGSPPDLQLGVDGIFDAFSRLLVVRLGDQIYAELSDALELFLGKRRRDRRRRIHIDQRPAFRNSTTLCDGDLDRVAAVIDIDDRIEARSPTLGGVHARPAADQARIRQCVAHQPQQRGVKVALLLQEVVGSQEHSLAPIDRPQIDDVVRHGVESPYRSLGGRFGGGT